MGQPHNQKRTTINLDNPILKGASDRFLSNDFPYVYARNQSSRSLVDGREIYKDKTGSVTGPGVECTEFVYQSMLTAGFVLDSVRSRANDIASGVNQKGNKSPELQSINDFKNIRAGDIILFDGHAAIVESYDPNTGAGVFVGSQGSPGEGGVGPSFSPFQLESKSNTREYWNFDRLKGVYRPTDSAYDPVLVVKT